MWSARFHFSLVLWLSLMCDASRATYFAFSQDAEHVVVAIDSRQAVSLAFGRIIYRDDKCNLTPLADRGFFFAEGLIGNSDPRAKKFDGASLAQTLFEGNFTNLQDVAERWAGQMSADLTELQRVLPELVTARDDGNIVNAYFVGFDDQHKLQMLVAAVKQNTTSQFALANEVRPVPSGVSFGGLRQEAIEYAAGNTSRSVSARAAALQKASKFEDSLDRLAVVLQEAVQVIPAWADDPGSGGEVAVLIITASPPAMRWFHKPPFCP